MAALVHIVGHSQDTDLTEKARGFLTKMKEEECFMADTYFLVALTRLLKCFSLRFQESDLTVDNYINTVGQFKLAIKEIDLNNLSPAVQYWFEDYLDQLNQPLLVDPMQRSTRRLPTIGADAVHTRVNLVEQRKEAHPTVIKHLLMLSESYWFNHEYWQRTPGNITRLQNMGHMFNGISDALELPLKDPIRPTKKRCSNCNKIGHSCPGATQIAIPSLVQSFKRVSDVVPDALTGLSDRPEHVNID